MSCNFNIQYGLKCSVEDNGGHWGVGINAETRELLVAISSLIRCGRVKQALAIIDNELAGGC